MRLIRQNELIVIFKYKIFELDVLALTKANYKLPTRKKVKLSKKQKDHKKRLEFENTSYALKGFKGSFVVFREKGLEDVFIVDDL